MKNPKWTPQSVGNAILVNGYLFLQSTCVVLVQLLSLLLRPLSYGAYRYFISYTMRMWSQNLVALVQYFAPSSLVLTFDDSCFLKQDDMLGETKVVLRDNTGRITGLSLPERTIVMANHQVPYTSGMCLFWKTSCTVLKLSCAEKRYTPTGFTYGALRTWRMLTVP